MREQSPLTAVWDLLDQVRDPEIPVLSIWDLGILTGIEQDGDTLVVSITPTYSGCPAMDAIQDDIGQTLEQGGYRRYRVKRVLSPAWNTGMMSPEGLSRLEAYGIAAPLRGEACAEGECKISCPHCGSVNTERISEFGSTACKALYRCRDCQEPFDYFKEI